MVRISVANLASYLRNTDKGGRTVAIGVANKKLFEDGRPMLWQALGGAATMTPEGRKLLEETCGAEFQGEGNDKDDARFVVSAQHAEEVLCLLERNCAYFCEYSPMREVLHELEQESFGDCTIIAPGSLVNAYSVPGGAFRQASADDGVGTSTRASGQDIPTKRLFFIHTLCVHRDVFLEILASPFVRRLDEGALDTTQMGRTRGVCRGESIADNLCNWIPGHLT